MSELFAEILSNAKQAHHLSTDSACLPSAPPGTGGHVPVLVRTHSTRTHHHHRGAGNISAYSTDTHCPAVWVICTEESPGMLTLSTAVSAPPRSSPFFCTQFFFFLHILTVNNLIASKSTLIFPDKYAGKYNQQLITTVIQLLQSGQRWTSTLRGISFCLVISH